MRAPFLMSDSRAFNLDVADCAQGSHWSGHLPPAVQSAIQTKLEEEQKALEMQFVRERTRQEAVRKQIEATGIAGYQSIISKGLNAQVIEWKGIEAAEKLAESPNSKVIIVGAGKDGLPVILNTSSAIPAQAANR